jgi:general stress protein 26
MSEPTYIHDRQAIRKLQDLVTEINICLFCSGSPMEEQDRCRPMSTSGVDEEGSIWFMSERNSEKNNGIVIDPRVKLYYSHPGKTSFLIVSGRAEIVVDRGKIHELWTPLDRSWFPEGEADPNISLIRVRPDHAHFWDTKGGRMVNFIKMVDSLASPVH